MTNGPSFTINMGHHNSGRTTNNQTNTTNMYGPSPDNNNNNNTGAPGGIVPGGTGITVPGGTGVPVPGGTGIPVPSGQGQVASHILGGSTIGNSINGNLQIICPLCQQIWLDPIYAYTRYAAFTPILAAHGHLYIN